MSSAIIAVTTEPAKTTQTLGRLLTPAPASSPALVSIHKARPRRAATLPAVTTMGLPPPTSSTPANTNSHLAWSLPRPLALGQRRRDFLRAMVLVRGRTQPPPPPILIQVTRPSTSGHSTSLFRTITSATARCFVSTTAGYNNRTPQVPRESRTRLLLVA